MNNPIKRYAVATTMTENRQYATNIMTCLNWIDAKNKDEAKGAHLRQCTEDLPKHQMLTQVIFEFPSIK